MPSSAATAQSPNFNRGVIEEKTWWRYYNFLHDNPDLEHDIWSICDDLYMNPFLLPGRCKNNGRDKGIALTVDIPRGNPAIANLDRPAYLRQQFIYPESSCEVSG